MLKPIQHRAGNIIISKIPTRRYSDISNREPLRVLFCGSDAFSIASLKALCNEYRKSPKLVESIDVVCRSPKRTGRGLKTLREGRSRNSIPCLASSLVGGSTHSVCGNRTFSPIASNRHIYRLACESFLELYLFKGLSLEAPGT